MRVKGVFGPPGDKSISHRVALMSLLAEGEAEVTNFSPCADVASSIEAARLLGSRFERDGDTLTVRAAAGAITAAAAVDCGNSGTTMRLLMGVLAGAQGGYVLDGDNSLRRRPMERVAEPLRRMGAVIDCPNGRCPVDVRGRKLRGIEYTLPVASAQLKSAVLLAGLNADGPTSVKEPMPSRDHTERLIRAWGGPIAMGHGTVTVERSMLKMPSSFQIPGDVSSAAFLLCAAAIVPGSSVIAENVLLNPTRTGFLTMLSRMGADVAITPHGETPEPWGTVSAAFSPDLSGCRVTADEIPAMVDEVPIMALVATQARGTTVFEGVSELRVKESDRIAAIVSQLSHMGARIAAEADALIVEGPSVLRAPQRLDSFHDHRIAMTLRVAGLLDGTMPEIAGEESVAISFPGFQETLTGLLA